MTVTHDETFKILLVCTGNVCRSPQAGQLMQAELDQVGEPWRSAVVISSAGTRALEGSAMDEETAAISVKFGARPAEHRARQLTPAMVEEADLVLVMAREHRSEVVRAAPRSSRKAFVLVEFADLLESLERASTRQPQPPAPSGPAMSTLPDTLRQGVERAAARRGMTPPRDPKTVDVLDPYGQASRVHRESAQQIRESLGRIHGSVRRIAQDLPW